MSVMLNSETVEKNRLDASIYENCKDDFDKTRKTKLL